MEDASPSVPLHQVCHVLSIAPLYSVLLSHCTSSVTPSMGASRAPPWSGGPGSRNSNGLPFKGRRPIWEIIVVG